MLERIVALMVLACTLLLSACSEQAPPETATMTPSPPTQVYMTPSPLGEAENQPTAYMIPSPTASTSIPGPTFEPTLTSVPT